MPGSPTGGRAEPARPNLPTPCERFAAEVAAFVWTSGRIRANDFWRAQFGAGHVVVVSVVCVSQAGSYSSEPSSAASAWTISSSVSLASWTRRGDAAMTSAICRERSNSRRSSTTMSTVASP